MKPADGQQGAQRTLVREMLVVQLAFAAFVGTVTLIRLKNEILQREKHRPWVRQMLERG